MMPFCPNCHCPLDLRVSFRGSTYTQVATWRERGVWRELMFDSRKASWQTSSTYLKAMSGVSCADCGHPVASSFRRRCPTLPPDAPLSNKGFLVELTLLPETMMELVL